MPYLNIDAQMDEHPKIDALSDAAYRLHSSAMQYSAHWMTDGFIPRSKARRLTATASDVVITELVDSGVWHDAGEGCQQADCVEARTCHAEGRAGYYIIHDYLQWNHSREWWEKRYRRDAERKAKWKAQRASRDGSR